MDKTEKLLEISNCEICKQKESNESVNIGLDIGYHIGNYREKIKIYHRVKPKCVAICSLYLCKECKTKMMEERMFSINVLPKLKKLIKSNLIKQMIIESLK